MHGPILALLTLLFSLRVLGQALVVFAAVDWLPASEHWFSGLIPYRILLVVQIILLAGMIKISADISRGQGIFAVTRCNWSRILIVLSALYAGSMVARYILRMIFQPEMRWLGDAIPIFFHFVLAGFIYIWGCYHARNDIFARDKNAC